MEDFFALLILGLAWSFGGAALFHKPQNSATYVEVLRGWTALNLLVIAITFVVIGLFWALERVLF